MATAARDPRRQDSASAEDRAVPPIRWPHPGGATFALIGVWVLGMLLAVFVPATIVPPSQDGAPTSDVLLALGCTLAGAAVMIGVGLTFMRRHADPVATAFGVVSGVTVAVGGLIMAATKLTGA